LPLRELLARTVQLLGDALLDRNQRAELAGEAHFAHHLPEEIAQKRELEARCEILDQRGVARHRLGQDDVRATNRRPLHRRNLELLPCTLGAKPERQRSDLRGARVDVHAVEIVLNNECWRGAPEAREVWVVVSQTPTRRLTSPVRRRCPCLLVDREKKVEAVEEEMTRAAGRVENAQVARILPRTISWPLVFAPHEVAAPRGEVATVAVHLEPRPSERVVDEKLHHVARREELVADSQLAAVARCLALVPHPLT